MDAEAEGKCEQREAIQEQTSLLLGVYLLQVSLYTTVHESYLNINRIF